MARLLSIVLCFALNSFIAHAQFSNGNVILDLSGSYIESYTSSGVNVSQYSTKTKTLDMSISIGYCLNNQFTVGFGMEYMNYNQFTRYEFQFPDAIALAELLDQKSNIFAPRIFFRYNKNLIGNLFFLTELSSSYGFVSTSQESSQLGIINLIETSELYDVSNSHAAVTRTSDKSGLFQASLCPEFVYFISPGIGLLLKIGGIQYYSYDFDAHEWHVTLNPSTWEYGFCLKFGK